MRPSRVAGCLAVVLSLMVGCSKKGGADPKAAVNAISIGEYGSLNGADTTFGVSTDHGVQLAVQQRNAAGGVNGKQIALKVYDDNSKSQEAGNAVTRLIQDDHVVAIIGEVASGRSIVGGQVAQENGVPMISPSSTRADVTAIGDMVSRVCFIDSYQGKVCADFALNNLKLDRAAILYKVGNPYSEGLQGDFRKAFEAGGGKIVAAEAFNSGSADYSAPLTKIRNAGPQVIFVPVYYSDIVSIARQARKLGIAVPLMGSDGWVSEKLRDAGDALDGCYFSDHYAREEGRPEVKTFLEAYRAQYHSDPDSMAALGYDATNLLFDAMTRAKSLSGPDLAAAINSTKGFKGVTGSITIDADRNATKGCVIEVLDKTGNYKMFAKIPAPK